MDRELINNSSRCHLGFERARNTRLLYVLPLEQRQDEPEVAKLKSNSSVTYSYPQQ